MKKINADNIFSVFSTTDQSSIPGTEVDAIDHCHNAIAGLLIGVENFYILDHLYTAKYNDSYNSMRQSLQLKCYSTLLQNVDRYDEIPSGTVKSIKKQFGKPMIEFALNDMLKCFLDIEMYSHCASVNRLIKTFKVKNLH